MPAAALPFPYLDEAVAENKIQLFIQWHRHRHISKERALTRHMLYVPYDISFFDYITLTQQTTGLARN
jgi:hypothetical protein